MKFRMVHNNFNVLDLEKSLKFYADAFDMKEVRRINAKDGSFIIVYLEDGSSAHQLELTWLRDRKEPYDLGDNEFHLAFRVDDYEAAHARHEKMGCICYENPAMGIYFVTDPEQSPNHEWNWRDQEIPAKKVLPDDSGQNTETAEKTS
ncbi:MAG: VOC family protein [Lentisphaeria bacterium]|nr:VOC family protein [Lentisphaeria bacterium]